MKSKTMGTIEKDFGVVDRLRQIGSDGIVAVFAESRSLPAHKLAQLNFNWEKNILVALGMILPRESQLSETWLLPLGTAST